MKRSRAFTMIEMVLAVALTAVVLTAVASIYVFASVRLSDAYTKSSLYDQMNGVADRIEATIRNADSCSVRDSGATLVCGMPQNGVDSNGDGHKDIYYPDNTDSNGAGTYHVGSYVWFYIADSSGVYRSQSGSSLYVWRAERPGGMSNPNAGNIDTSFAYYYGSILRYPLVNTVGFAVNAPNNTVTFTVTGSTRIGAETSVGAGDASVGRTVTLTRTVEWRN